MQRSPREALASVLFCHYGAHGALYEAAIARLGTMFGSKLNIYVRSSVQATRLRNGPLARTGAEVHVLPDADTLLSLAPADEKQLIALARDYEHRSGMTINTIAMTHRWFGRGYLPGAQGSSGWSVLRNHTYMGVLRYFVGEVAYWDREIQRHNATALLFGLQSAYAAARVHNVHFRHIDSARQGNLWFWVDNTFFQSSLLQHEIRQHRSSVASVAPQGDTIPADYAYSFAGASINRMRNGLLLRYLPRTICRLMKAHLVARLSGARLPSSFRSQVKTALRGIRHAKFMSGPHTRRADDLEGPYVFFPLHKEPETALQMASPEMFNQLDAITRLSRHLPAGIRLLVKEHPKTLGRRDDGFYRQLTALPNVELVNCWEPARRVIARAIGVAAISGTAGYEASLLGLPTIVFAHRIFYAHLPSVRVATSDEELGEAVRWMTNGKHDTDGYRAYAELLKANLAAISFDMENYDGEVDDQVPIRVVDNFIDTLVRSLSAEITATDEHTRPASEARSQGI